MNTRRQFSSNSIVSISFRALRRVLLMALVAISVFACSGIETIPDDTATFVATNYQRYAWRSEALTGGSLSQNQAYVVDAAVRGALDKRMSELGYQLVAKEDAQFLVEYLAAPGINDGLLPSTVASVRSYPSATINRQVDGASADNAYALGGVKHTGNVLVVFTDSTAADILWRVTISTVVQDANRVDPDAITRAIRQGLSTLPDAP